MYRDGDRLISLFINSDSMIHLIIATTKELNFALDFIHLEVGKTYNFEITVDGVHKYMELNVDGKKLRKENVEGIIAH